MVIHSPILHFTPPVLVFYCYITNDPKTYWLKQQHVEFLSLESMCSLPESFLAQSQFSANYWPVSSLSSLPCRPLYRVCHNTELASSERPIYRQNGKESDNRRESAGKMEVSIFHHLIMEVASYYFCF